MATRGPLHLHEWKALRVSRSSNPSSFRRRACFQGDRHDTSTAGYRDLIAGLTRKASGSESRSTRPLVKSEHIKPRYGSESVHVVPHLGRLHGSRHRERVLRRSNQRGCSHILEFLDCFEATCLAGFSNLVLPVGDVAQALIRFTIFAASANILWCSLRILIC